MAQLREHFDDDQVVEIVAVIANFGFLNRWNGTMATQLERSPLAWASEHLGDTGWEAGKHTEPSVRHPLLDEDQATTTSTGDR